MTDQEAEQIVKASAKVIVEAVASALDGDMHNISTRPCETCRFVSNIVGRPFGCIRFAITKNPIP